MSRFVFLWTHLLLRVLRVMAMQATKRCYLGEARRSNDGRMS